MRPRTLIGTLAVAASLAACGPSSDFGTEKDARAMLEKVVAELNRDKVAALAMFNKGEGGFRDRDLYPFCAGSDGIVTVHPTDVGVNIKDRKDKMGKAFGEEMLSVAQEGKFVTVSYMWPRPGGTEPIDKVSFVTKVGDQICGVGYYK